MYKFVGLYLLAILGVFVEPDFLGSVGNVFFKLLVLAGISFLLYEIWNNKSAVDENEDKLTEAADSVIASPEPVFDIIPTRLDNLISVNENLRQFLINQFTIYWNYTLPHNGYLLYKNGSENTKIFEKRTNSHFIDGKEPDFSLLIALVAQNDGMVIENNLEDTSVLFPFYNQAEFKPQSLLAFKTQLDPNQVLFWFFDAQGNNFFNIQDKALLLQINNNTLFAVKETMQNQNLIDDSKETKHVSELAHLLNQAINFDQCIDFFTDFLINEFEASKFTIALREEDSDKATIQKSIGIDDSYKKGASFSLNEGLHGWVILKNKPYLIDNIDKGEYFVPRFSRSEKTNFALRSFLSVPLQTAEEAFGMISLEDKIENKYSENDKSRLISFSNILASAFIRFKEDKIEIGE